MATTKLQTGKFGTIYTRFKHRPVQAIKHLMKTREGECLAALYREGVGDIDIVWGENDANNRGFGLKHIIEKHGKEIEKLGFNVCDFIPLVIMYGELNEAKSTPNKRVFESKSFRLVVETNAHGRKKNWLLTAFTIKNARYK